MTWLRDPAWQQGVAILLVVVGAFLIYRGAAVTEARGLALLGMALFGIGIAFPLISQALSPPNEHTTRSEDV
jgi:hypothetical protein